MLKRRSLLGASLCLPFLAATSRASETDVVIVGAGSAGLAAAQTLKARGLSVIVVEARNRIGGRTFTSSAWADLPMDLGASWIHGVKGNPLTDLAKEAGAQIVLTDLEADMMLGPEGGEIDPDLGPAEELVESAVRAAGARETDCAVGEAVTESEGWKAADPSERRLVQHVLNSSMEQEYGGSVNRLSAWHGEAGEGFEGEDAIFPKGYVQIVDFLARGIDIRLNSPVREIGPGRVVLADGSLLSARHIIVSVPLGVLKSGRIRFSQPLDADRQAAIDRLEMGLLNKTWLRFSRVSWPDDVDWVEWLGPRPGEWAEWVSLARVLQQPVLLGFNAADQAARIEQLDDRETIASAHAALKAMFGNDFPAPEAGQVTRWAKDEWSLGSYSFNPVGYRPGQRESLFGTDWDGALGFCGEATSETHYGTVHGAVLSARALVKRMFG